MSFSTEMRTQSKEYAGVIRLANFYAAAHTKGKQQKIISQQLEDNIKIAQVTAQAFAKTNNIPYNTTLRDSLEPIITVLEHEKRWFPAELHPDKIRLLTNLGPLDLGGSLGEAIHMATIVALSKRVDSIPSIGQTLCMQNP